MQKDVLEAFRKRLLERLTSAGLARKEFAQEFANELMIFMSELSEEGERALVIGGTARVEVAVEHLLNPLP